MNAQARDAAIRLRCRYEEVPCNADGHIVSPLYSPDPAYRSKVMAWAEANPLKVPLWLIHDLALMRRRMSQAPSSTASCARRTPSTQPTDS